MTCINKLVTTFTTLIKLIEYTRPTLVPLATAPELRAVVKAAFPRYNKRQVFVGEFTSMRINSYWDGGSRDVYALVELATMRTHALPTASHPYFDVERGGGANRTGDMATVDAKGNITLTTLPEGFALVSAGTFMGKPATAFIYVPKENLTKFLPATV